MNVPMEINFRNMPQKETFKELIRNKAKKLEKFCDHISSCRVAVEQTPKPQPEGNSYRVRILIRTPPGEEIVIKRKPNNGHASSPLSTVVQNAFDAADRKVRELVDRRQNRIEKYSGQKMNGIVCKIKKKKGYGFLKTLDNREIFFRSNNVTDSNFNNLKPGDGIHYVEDRTETGALAASVQLVNGSIK